MSKGRPDLKEWLKILKMDGNERSINSLVDIPIEDEQAEDNEKDINNYRHKLVKTKNKSSKNEATDASNIPAKTNQTNQLDVAFDRLAKDTGLDGPYTTVDDEDEYEVFITKSGNKRRVRTPRKR